MRAHYDAIVAGGGVIGLAVARELALSGQYVLVLDPGNPSDAASWAAAGMLAPQSEAEEPSALFDFCLAGARLYPEWIAQLREESGIDPEYSASGLLALAASEEHLCRLKRAMDWQKAAGLDAELLTPEEVLRLEPRITLPAVGAVHLSGERQVTPRLLLEALRGACAAKGVDIQSNAATEVLRRGGRVAGVRTATGEFPSCCVILASGAGSSRIAGLQPAIPVTPRRGQILSLRPPVPVFQRLIRWESVYFVPRRNGEVVVGATNEDAGFDRSLTPARVGGLLQKAQQLSSDTGAWPIADMWTGLRPATPDGLPVVGRAMIDGLLYATGHYRNGILLAPVTAASVAALAAGRPSPVPLDAFSPVRFTASSRQ